MKQCYQSIILLCLILLPNLSHAQSETSKHNWVLHGKVIDAKTKEPIPFAHILRVHDLQGTTTAMTGKFKLSLSQVALRDSLRISCLGYQSKFLAIPDTGSILIELAPRRYEMNELTVKASSRLKHSHLGNRFLNPLHGYFAQAGFPVSSRSSSYIKQKWDKAVPFRIDRARVHINDMFNNDSLLMRVRFLSVHPKTGLPDSNLVKQNITTVFTEDKGWVTFDINNSENGVWLRRKEFYVVFDWVDSPNVKRPIAPMFSTDWFSSKPTLLDASGSDTHSHPLMHTLFISY
jgi:hypothetical protein